MSDVRRWFHFVHMNINHDITDNPQLMHNSNLCLIIFPVNSLIELQLYSNLVFAVVTDFSILSSFIMMFFKHEVQSALNQHTQKLLHDGMCLVWLKQPLDEKSVVIF